MSKKSAPDIFRFVSMLFLIFEKRDEQKIASEIFRFVIMLFSIFDKSNEQKNCARNLKIRKYAFF